jgi:prepilin-type processing-associated H-X9-DG protein
VPASAIIRHGNRNFAFADLRVGDHIQAKGTRDGSTLVASEIKVETGDDDEDDNDDNDLRGTISNLTGTCPAVSFFLGSTKVITTASTKFEDGGCSTLRNDLRVEVEGSRANDGSFVASKIERD